MWTRDALASEARPWRGTAWRVVEAQARASTMKLVDNLIEQELLEGILDRSKPAFPPACRGLHFLLATPFRYWPYPEGSRFRRAGQTDGCFYGADTPGTALAEQAFHRLLFFLEAPGMALPETPLEHTAFSVEVGSDRVLDLATPLLNRDAARWEHPTDYAPCQDLADAARGAGVGVIRYRSVRDPRRQMNVSLLTPVAFVSRQPETWQTWQLFFRPKAVQALGEMPRAAIEFRIEDWAGDPRVSAALGRV